MRVVFIGQSSKYSNAVLRAISKRYDIAGIVESAPLGYGLSSQISRGESILTSFRQCMRRELQLSVQAGRIGCHYMLLTKANADELERFLADLAADVGCVASMSQLLPERVLSLPKHGFINLHPSLLPRYRGPNPLFWQYYDMDLEGGFTIHFVDKGEDSGDIIRQEPFAIGFGMPIHQAWSVILERGPKAVVDVLDELAVGGVTRIPQAHLPCPRRARRVMPGEPLIQWEAWPLERVYHVLAGALSYGVGLDRVPNVLRRLRWRVAGMERQIAGGRPGSLRFDLRGPYLVHSEGRIRLRMSVAPY